MISFFIYSLSVSAQQASLKVKQSDAVIEVEMITISKEGSFGNIIKNKLDCSDIKANPEIKNAIVYVEGNKISSSEFGKINENAESIWTDNLATC